MLTSDRYHHTTATPILYSFIPTSVHQFCYELLADSIAVAHASRPSSWGISLFPNLVRLNVGMLEVCVLSQTGAYLILDIAELDENDADREEINWHMYSEKENGLYRSVDGSVGCECSYQHLPTIFPIIQPAYISLIKQAAQTRRNPQTRQGHSPGVIEALRMALSRTIPDPKY